MDEVGQCDPVCQAVCHTGMNQAEDPVVLKAPLSGKAGAEPPPIPSHRWSDRLRAGLAPVACSSLCGSVVKDTLPILPCSFTYHIVLVVYLVTNTN